MTNKELKNKAEEMIEAQIDISGLSREEVLDVSALCFMEQYIRDEITSEDLIELGNYLEQPFDMDEVEKIKATRKKQAEYRLNHKAKKLLERKRTKIGSKVRFKGNGLDQAVVQSLIEDYQKGKISKELLEKTIALTGLKVENLNLEKKED